MVETKAFQLTMAQWSSINQLSEILASSKSLATMGTLFTEQQVDVPAVYDYLNAVCHLLDFANTLCRQIEKMRIHSEDDCHCLLSERAGESGVEHPSKL